MLDLEMLLVLTQVASYAKVKYLGIRDWVLGISDGIEPCLVKHSGEREPPRDPIRKT
ncbi:hypothetical protein [Chamaesiphon sp. GL140_3_metabinner_50]|uniref:hypothetical protein n=1 Tax=Chamaesiphon sp. GL140_3_metabinner_50 TaxID=2970812 RepID=UPI0025E5D53B|nr:hypothetical protein [Chamaesiphon sp. GL140_3_metabinner_50]